MSVVPRGSCAVCRLLSREQTRLHVEHCGGEAVPVGNDLAHQRDWRGPRSGDLAHDGAEIEAELGVILARQLLHALVVGKTCHMEELEPAVARSKQGALEQHRADPVTLPRLLDREGGLALATNDRSYRTQLGDSAQYAVDKETMNDGIDAECELGVVAQELVGYRAGKTAAPALQIEGQEMRAGEIGFGETPFA